ncbi:hypothetical protein JCM10213_000311 [Rhodosporidiobolus nylandii]
MPPACPLATITATTAAQTLTTALGPLAVRGTTVPLEPTGALDRYSPVDLTPVIGTQLTGVQLTELLEAPSADELLRELAITITLDYAGTNRTGHRAVSLGEKPYFDASGRSRREALGLRKWLDD